MVQKVSAVVESGTHAGIYANTAGAQVSGVSLSTKAAQLVAPPRPILRRTWGCFSISFMVVGLAWTIACFIGGPTVPVSPPQTRAIMMLSGLILAFPALALVIILPIANTAIAKDRKKQYSISMSRYIGAKGIWDELYYCHRHDVVFRPGSPGAYVPASQMYRLL